jgi:hypothetical protein
VSGGWEQHVWSAMTETPAYGECRGGPHDGHRQAVTADTDIIWVGPAKAAWVIEAGLPPETVVGRNLHAYRWDGETLTADGIRVYAWVEPQESA